MTQTQKRYALLSIARAKIAIAMKSTAEKYRMPSDIAMPFTNYARFIRVLGSAKMTARYYPGLKGRTDHDEFRSRLQAGIEDNILTY
jgi:hypothetical protein